MYMDDAVIETGEEAVAGAKCILAQLMQNQLRVYFWGSEPRRDDALLGKLIDYFRGRGFDETAVSSLSYDEPEFQGWNYVALRLGDAFREQFAAFSESAALEGRTA